MTPTPSRESPPRRSRRPAVLGLLLVLGAALSSAAAAQTPSPAPAAPGVATGAKADDFLAVDCALPPQIRRLGARMTFLAPRRALKTTARDCEIRGGEYVSYDRADYATALKVWLDGAKQGD